MKRLFAIVASLFIVLPVVLADGADDQYIQIYNLIQDGDALSATQPAQAVAKYTEAQTDLQRFQKVYPAWDERIVNFRLNYLASKITILTANMPGVASPPVLAKPSLPASPQIVATPPVAPPQPVVSTAVTSAPVVPALVVSPPEVQTSTPPMIVLTPQPGLSTAELQNQIAELQSQLRQFQGEKSLLEAKLREALAARPAGADPRAFAEAQEKIRSIEKENELLQVSLAQEREKVASLANSSQLTQTRQELADTKRQLAEQTARTTQLAQENESLQAQVKTLTASTADLAAENAALKKMAQAKSPVKATAAASALSHQLDQAQTTIKSLEADKEVWALEKAALQNRVKHLSSGPAPIPPIWTQDSQQVKQLERERDDLQKKLDAAQKALYGRKGKTTAARVDELANDLETLRARLDVYESKPVPYTPEELALFKKPETRVADAPTTGKSARELPAGTVELVAEAERDFSAKSYEQAEQKYKEVLRQDGKNVNMLANLATIQLEMGHFDDADKNIKKALSVAPDDAFTLSILGNLKFRQGKYDEALDALSRAAKVDPRNAEIQNFLGLTLSQKGMRNAAETAFRKAIILNPDYAGAQNNLAVFYLTQEPPSLELARWHYDKAIAGGFPRNPEIEKLLDEKKTADSAK